MKARRKSNERNLAMKTEQHTPGPWIIRHGAGMHAPYILCVDPVAEILGLGKTPEANARLIAAAPEILAALHDESRRALHLA